MSPFWASFFEQLRDCGRSATLFIITLAFLFVLLALAGIIYLNDLQQYVVKAWPVAGFLVLAWVWGAVRRARRQTSAANISGPLSDNELSKARTKLSRKNGDVRQKKSLVQTRLA